jgi:hypothetical protein
MQYHQNSQESKVGQNRIDAPYMTVYLVIFLPKTPYKHHIYIYIYIALANPTGEQCGHKCTYMHRTHLGQIAPASYYSDTR